MSHRNPLYCHKQNPGEVTRAQFPLVSCHKQNPGEVTAAQLGLGIMARAFARAVTKVKTAAKAKIAKRKKK